MKLNFSLLIVDNQPENINQAIRALEDHLKDKGFLLNKEIEKEPTEQRIQQLACLEGKNYDLVMVDYKLGEEMRNGAQVALQLRRLMPYVDMVFYSGAPVQELLAELAELEVSGVFAHARPELGDTLNGLADTVIGKVVDLANLRGIAMAEVAEMENVMEQTLIQVFQSSDDQIARTKQKTIQDVRHRVKKIPKHLEQRLEESGLSGVVQDSSLFFLTHKYRVIKRLARLLPSGHSDQSKFLNAFEQDVIKHRNMLAHAQERMTEDGTTVLYSKISGKSEEKIDDGWMSDFRKKIQEHKSAVDVICTSLKKKFGAEELAGNSE